MDSGTLVAVTSLVSTVVIVITAIAAFRQLRHDRNANDIVVYLRLMDRMDSDGVRTARAMLETMDERLDATPSLREQQFASREAIVAMWPVIELLRSLEHISVLVIRGEIAEGLILAEYAEIFPRSVHGTRLRTSGHAFETLYRKREDGARVRGARARPRDPSLGCLYDESGAEWVRSHSLFERSRTA